MIGRNGHVPTPAAPPGPRGYGLTGPPGPRGASLVRRPASALRVARADPETVRRVQAEASRRLARSGGGSDDLTVDMESEVRRVISDERIVGDEFVIDELVRSVLAQMSGIGWLQEYLDDTEIENVRIIGSEPTFVDLAGGGQERREPVAATDAELTELVRDLAARLGRSFGKANPFVHLQLPDGSRMSASVGVSHRPHVALRRHRLIRQDLVDLAAMGTMSPELADFLEAAVRIRRNILVSGAMNAGKTTLLRAMCAAVPPEESIYLAELVGELGLERMKDRHPQCVTYEYRDTNTEGAGEVTMAEIVRESARFNVKRVMVGEVLGDEVIPMLRAMSAGQAGSMGTIHADSSLNAFQRLVMYCLQAREPLQPAATNMLVAETIHLVVHVEIVWQAINGRGPRMQRVVSSVQEVTGTTGDDRRVSASEVWKPGPDRRAVWSGTLRGSTAELLESVGWRHPGPVMR